MSNEAILNKRTSVLSKDTSLLVASLCFFVVLVEGYDIAAMAFALPGLIRAWAITDLRIVGPLLASSIVGMLVGSPLLGRFGDRYGRRLVIIGACLLFAVFTGLMLLAQSIQQLVILRFMAGVGLGGAAPNVVALMSEYAPPSRRGFLVTGMFSGIGLGGALPGIVAALLVPHYGWHVIFAVGTVLPILAIVLCLVWLPESESFLAAKAQGVAGATVDRAPDAYHGVASLFRGRLAGLTSLFWIATAGNYMTYFFLLSWTPMLLSMSHLPAGMAGLAQTIFQIGGVLGGLTLGRLLDTKGTSVLGWFMLVAAAPTALVGVITPSEPAVLFAAEFLAGFCILGSAYGFGSVAAMLYPAQIRATGAGWGLGSGRLGSIVSTVSAGLLGASGLKASSLFLIATAPLLVSAFACFALTHLNRKRSGAAQGRSPDAALALTPVTSPTAH